MALIVDASVAVKWLVVEEDSADARGLLDDEELHAPRLLVSEVANAVWRKVRLDQVDRGSADQLLATMSDMPVRWHADETICADAIRLARRDSTVSLRIPSEHSNPPLVRSPPPCRRRPRST